MLCFIFTAASLSSRCVCVIMNTLLCPDSNVKRKLLPWYSYCYILYVSRKMQHSEQDENGDNNIHIILYPIRFTWDDNVSLLFFYILL